MQSPFYAISLAPVRFADELKRIQSRIALSDNVSISSIDVVLHGLLASLLCKISCSEATKTNSYNNSHHDTKTNANNNLNITSDDKQPLTSNVKSDKPT